MNRNPGNTCFSPVARVTTVNSVLASGPSVCNPILSPPGHHTGQPPVSATRFNPFPSGCTTNAPPPNPRSGLNKIHFPSGDHRGTVPGASTTLRASAAPFISRTYTCDTLSSVLANATHFPSGEMSAYESLVVVFGSRARVGPPFGDTRPMLSGSAPQVL